MPASGPVRGVRDALRDAVGAARDRDPAAEGVGRLEVLLAWPGVQALLVHRLAHALHRRGVPVLPRTLVTWGRALTGAEIHPAAHVGRRVFIDHATGVVVGETARIGDGATLFQGATLGGLGRGPGRRHPVVEDGVLIGAGARVLGAITVGAGGRIGANAVVLADVPPGATVVGSPARVVREGAPSEEGDATRPAAPAGPR